MSGTAIVTGGAGFIGSHVVDSLLGDGYEVVVVDDLTTGRADHVDPRAELAVLDITDADALDSLFDSTRPRRVFHLAAQSMVTVSVKDPSRDCEVNVLGTLNVLQAAGRHGAPVVFTSTGGALYGDGVPLPTPETQIPPQSLPTAPRSGPARRTCAPGRSPPPSRTRCAGWATSTGRARARTARRA